MTRARFPLYVQVLAGVVLGALLGVVFNDRPILFGIHTAQLGQIGMLVIKLLKALAIPLIFLSIVDSFLKTSFTLKQGARLIGFCALNVSVAMSIGLLLMNTIRPGERWQGKLEALIKDVAPTSADKILEQSKQANLDPVTNLAGFVPESFVEPFSKNNVIGVVLLALLAGVALRKLMADEKNAAKIHTLAGVVEAAFEVLVKMLHLVIQAVPFAVFGVVAQVVGKSGLAVFGVLWVFLADPILTALSCNSSLATVPITLVALEKMRVSKESARLAACVGTNLNNDGITLYEAMAALFLAQALGFHLSLSAQMGVVLHAIMAGAGIAGIPEAGLIVLPLVLSGAGLPDSVVAAALPLVMTVDWIVARVRSGVNTMSDMVIAILVDATTKREPVLPNSELAANSSETA